MASPHDKIPLPQPPPDAAGAESPSDHRASAGAGEVEGEGDGGGLEGRQQEGERGAGGGRFWGALAVLFGVSLLIGVGLALQDGAPPTAPDGGAGGAGSDQEKQIGAPLRAGVVQGQILTAGRRPLQGARVKLERLGRSEAGEAAIEATTDVEGRFRLGPVQRLGHRLSVEAEGHEGRVVERLMPGGDPLVIELTPGAGFMARVVFGGKPVEGAHARIGGAGVWPPLDFVTGPDGLLTTSPLPAGELEILVRARGKGGASLGAFVEVSHDGSVARTPPTISLSPGVTVNLLVEDAETGEPIPGAFVTVAQDVVHVLSLGAWSDARGEVSIFGLPRISYRVTISASGYLQATPRLALDEAEAVMDVVTSLKKAGASGGVVTNAVGTPLELVKLTAHVTTEDGQQWVISQDTTASASGGGLGGGLDGGLDGSASGGDLDDALGGSASGAWLGSSLGLEGGFGFFTDEAGRFEIVGLPSGKIHIEASKDGFESAIVGPVTLGKGARLDGMKIVLSVGHTIEGRVLGPDGSPLEGAWVTIGPVEEAAGGGGPLPGMSALRQRLVVTDADGRFEADDLPARVTVKARAEGFEEASLSADLVGDREPVELTLGALSGAIQGRVLLGGEVPLAGVRLWHQPAPGEGSRSAEACVGVSDEGGRFSLEGCPAEPFWVEIIPEGQGAERAAAGWARIDPEGGERDYPLARASAMSLRIVDEAERVGLARAHVVLRPKATPEGAAPWVVERLALSTATDQDGLAIFEGIAPGAYGLAVSLEGYQSQGQDLEVLEVASEMEIGMSSARVIEGGVTDRHGAPVAGAQVEVTVVGGGAGAQVAADAGGRFSVRVASREALRVDAVDARLGRGSRQVEGGAEAVRDLVIELKAPTVDLETWGGRLEAVGARLWRDGDQIVVESVEEGSAASEAGLARGDLAVSARAAAGKIRVEVEREGKRITLQIKE